MTGKTSADLENFMILPPIDSDNELLITKITISVLKDIIIQTDLLKIFSLDFHPFEICWTL